MKNPTKNEIFVEYWSLYFHNTECKAVPLNATENPLFSPLKYEKNITNYVQTRIKARILKGHFTKRWPKKPQKQQNGGFSPGLSFQDK